MPLKEAAGTEKMERKMLEQENTKKRGLGVVSKDRPRPSVMRRP